MTLVYQIEDKSKRLIAVIKDRKTESLEGFFMKMGTSWCENIKVACSDMWRPYLKVIAEKLPNALNILDRFHIVKKLNEAVNKVRVEEVKQYKTDGYEPVMTGSTHWFMKKWCPRVMRSRLDPMKKFVKTLRNHEHLLMNNLKTNKKYSSGIVEGLNLRVNLSIRKAYGYRGFNILQVSLYHTLGCLPEPEFTHKFT